MKSETISHVRVPSLGIRDLNTRGMHMMTMAGYPLEYARISLPLSPPCAVHMHTYIRTHTHNDLISNTVTMYTCF